MSICFAAEVVELSNPSITSVMMIPSITGMMLFTSMISFRNIEQGRYFWEMVSASLRIAIYKEPREPTFATLFGILHSRESFWGWASWTFYDRCCDRCHIARPPPQPGITYPEVFHAQGTMGHAQVPMNFYSPSAWFSEASGPSSSRGVSARNFAGYPNEGNVLDGNTMNE